MRPHPPAPLPRHPHESAPQLIRLCGAGFLYEAAAGDERRGRETII